MNPPPLPCPRVRAQFYSFLVYTASQVSLEACHGIRTFFAHDSFKSHRPLGTILAGLQTNCFKSKISFGILLTTRDLFLLILIIKVIFLTFCCYKLKVALTEIWCYKLKVSVTGIYCYKLKVALAGI